MDSDAEFSPLKGAGFVDTYDVIHPRATPAERSTFHNFTGRQDKPFHFLLSNTSSLKALPTLC